MRDTKGLLGLTFWLTLALAVNLSYAQTGTGNILGTTKGATGNSPRVLQLTMRLNW